MSREQSLPFSWRVILDGKMLAPETIDLDVGRAVICVRRRPGRFTSNEDSALVAPLDGRRAVLAVADGAGGLPDGSEASKRAILALAQALLDDDLPIADRIRRGFEEAHRDILQIGTGAATTVSLVLIDGNQLTSWHVGDSMTLVVGVEGQKRLQTVPHSPVGYALDAGLLTEQEAIRHEDLHLVSNLLGVGEPTVEIAPAIRLEKTDTVLLGSDGLFDNLLASEICSHLKSAPVERGAQWLVDEAWKRMTQPRQDDPSKPDDLSMILFRTA